MSRYYDLIISGSGITGAALAARLGRSKFAQSKKILLLDRTTPKFPKFEDKTHIIRDFSSQFKSMQVQMNDFDEERDNADLERRELFSNLKKVVNFQEK